MSLGRSVVQVYLRRAFVPAITAAYVLVGAGAPAIGAASALVAPFNVPSPHSGGKQTACKPPPPPVISLATESIYEEGDPTHSKIDPAAKARYDAAVAPLRDFSQEVARMAARYVRSDGQDTGAANCLISWLASWARGDALNALVTRQAALSATRILSGIALAYIEVKRVGGSAPAKAAIDGWLRKLGEQTTGVFGDKGNSNLGNHRYWGGLAAGAVAIAVDDRPMLDWARWRATASVSAR